jgi:hypothetical protein
MMQLVKVPLGDRLSSRSEGDHKLPSSVAWSLKMREDNPKDQESSKRRWTRSSRETGPSQISSIGFGWIRAGSNKQYRVRPDGAGRISQDGVDRLRHDG